MVGVTPPLPSPPASGGSEILTGGVGGLPQSPLVGETLLFGVLNFDTALCLTSYPVLQFFNILYILTLETSLERPAQTEIDNLQFHLVL